jgi:HK97 family phage portal protein
MNAVPAGGGGWLTVIRESFPGAFQKHVTIDAPRDILAFSGVFSPVTLIAGDVAKPRVKLVEEDEDGICEEVSSTSPFLTVLKKPNHYQNRIQFWSQWILSKLLWGNTYVLKVREKARGMVKSLYILDPARVKPLVSETGDVYYELSPDHLSGLVEKTIIPASEIIHDRWNCLWHPLVGVSPLYACALSATQGRKIQNNSTLFFENSSRPSGMLVAPGAISDELALTMKTRWEENYGGANTGRTAVLGNGLKYEAIGIPAQEAQLFEQLGWTKFDCADCFHMPHFKVGGPVPAGSTIEALQLQYYNDCLHGLFESAELCLDEGLEVPPTYYTEFDIDVLLRMDQATQVKMLVESVKGIRTPNEARAKLNLEAVTGGDAVYLQQQNYSTEALAKRDAKDDPFATAGAKAPAAGGASEPDEERIQGPLSIHTEGMTMNVPGMEHVARMVQQLERTMRMPVVPVKDVNGVILYGRRMERLPLHLQDGDDAIADLSELFINGLESEHVNG